MPLPRRNAIRAAIHARRIITFAYCPRTVKLRRRYTTLPSIPRLSADTPRIFPPPPPPLPHAHHHHPPLPDDSVSVRSYYYPPRNNDCATSFISRLLAGAIAKSPDRLLAQTLFSAVSYRIAGMNENKRSCHQMKIVERFEEFNEALLTALIS